MRKLIATFFTTLLLSSGTASAADLPLGRIVGRVIDAETRKPIASAAVVSPEFGLGATSDQDGRFSISIPAGRRLIRASFLGYHPFRTSLEVQPGDTARVEIPLLHKVRTEPAKIVAVLAPDSIMVNRIRVANEVRLFPLEPMRERLAEVQTPGTGDRRYMGSWKIRGKDVEPNRAWRDSLIRVLTNPETYLHESLEGIQPCIPMPGVGIRLSRDTTMTDVEICFECGMVFMQSTGLRPSGGRLAPASAPLRLLIKQAFPADSTIQALP